VSFATEQVGERFGPAVTGVMQSTLGNLPELFVVIFALKAGEVVVAQTSILGSLFANALLVLGGVILIGARAADDGVMRFSTRLPNDTATLLLLANFIIVLIAVALSSHDPASRHVTRSRRSARSACWSSTSPGCCRTCAASRASPGEGEHGRGCRWRVGDAARARRRRRGVRSRLVHPRARPRDRAARRLEAFAGLVIVAIAGNAVENFTGSCSPASASRTWRSRWSRTPSRRSPRSCSRRWC
jgi:Ca2+:H+ antiporter